MTLEEKEIILSSMLERMKRRLLKNSGKWDNSWDAVELRWLILRAAEYEASGFGDRRTSRWGRFKNDWNSQNLY